MLTPESDRRSTRWLQCWSPGPRPLVASSARPAPPTGEAPGPRPDPAVSPAQAEAPYVAPCHLCRSLCSTDNTAMSVLLPDWVAGPVLQGKLWPLLYFIPRTCMEPGA